MITFLKYTKRIVHGFLDGTVITFNIFFFIHASENTYKNQ